MPSHIEEQINALFASPLPPVGSIEFGEELEERGVKFIKVSYLIGNMTFNRTAVGLFKDHVLKYKVNSPGFEGRKAVERLEMNDKIRKCFQKIS